MYNKQAVVGLIKIKYNDVKAKYLRRNTLACANKHW